MLEKLGPVVRARDNLVEGPQSSMDLRGNRLLACARLYLPLNKMMREARQEYRLFESESVVV